MSIRQLFKVHLWTLPRWFALPYFGAASILGSYLAGGDLGNLDTWLAFILVGLMMARGHVVNTELDYFWTGLDRGESRERSAEKFYCGGQNVIEAGLVSRNGLWINETLWTVPALVIAVLLAGQSAWIPILFIGSLAVAYWYSWGKFNWTHELSLGVACGPLPVLIGMYAIDAHADWDTGLLVSVPFAIILSFAGLALDEYPDAKANLEKGVKSIAYEVYRRGTTLSTYLLGWFLVLYIYQVWLIDTGRLADWTALTFLLWPPTMAALVFLNDAAYQVRVTEMDLPQAVKFPDAHDYFSRVATWIVAIGGLYPVLLVIGQAVD